jgi:hypothetical protein
VRLLAYDNDTQHNPTYSQQHSFLTKTIQASVHDRKKQKYTKLARPYSLIKNGSFRLEQNYNMLFLLFSQQVQSLCLNPTTANLTLSAYLVSE